MTDVHIHLEVNDDVHEVVVPARMTLADLLRDRLGLTGTHLGCEHGVCGACTILVDGASVRSCIMLAAQAHGRQVTTIEGASPPDGGLSPLQQAFADQGALQCGFCTPGFVLAADELLDREPDPDEQWVREALSGNLCRCTGYQGIVQAVLSQANTATPSAPSWDDSGPAPGANELGAPPRERQRSAVVRDGEPTSEHAVTPGGDGPGAASSRWVRWTAVATGLLGVGLIVWRRRHR